MSIIGIGWKNPWLLQLDICASAHLQLRNTVLVESEDNSPAGNDHGTPNQVRLTGHQANRFFARRRMVLHTFFPVNLVARVEKILVVALADQFLELRGAEFILGEVAKIKLETAPLHEASRLAARGAIGFVQEFDHFAVLRRTACIGFSS